jgi:serine phosphatase RsbU (regulator of sigma subunit)/CHASE3 domain sensor protein
MSLRARAYAAIAAAIILLAVLGAVLLEQSSAVRRSVDEVLQRYDPAAAQASLLTTSVSDMQRGLSSYLLTGSEAELRPYVDGSRTSDLALQRLEQLLADDDQLLQVVGWTQSSRQSWITNVARPTIDAARSGNLDAALALYQDPSSTAAFNTLAGDTATLVALIGDRRATAFTALTVLSYSLIRIVVVSLALLLGSIVLAAVLGHRWVLRPLDRLRGQLRQVAQDGEHHQMIVPVGPPELMAVGRDAEQMRRHLVLEIDQAKAAVQALEQDAPLVRAIQAELGAGDPVAVPGLHIHGSLQPAEGVLAGDWWDSAVLPTGEAAVVVCDVSGHGPAAGIAALQLKQAIVHDLGTGADLAEIALSAAAVFADSEGRFATVMSAAIHPQTGHVRWINAGHHEALLVDPDGSVVEELGPTGPILSWLGGAWGIGTTVLPPDHSLLLYSDGLVESHDGAGEELGVEQLRQWLRQAPADQRAPAELVGWLLGKARERAVDWHRDDVTMVVVRRAPGPQDSAVPPRRGTSRLPRTVDAATRLRRTWEPPAVDERPPAQPPSKDAPLAPVPGADPEEARCP